ncbi:hypothetical protein EVA_06614 [gut metagenome]|uniref:Uncharacterized protein n=1 Tax=gut metagenome TaxID=749906 RepID=J9GRS2_9ZZZZ
MWHHQSEHPQILYALRSRTQQPHHSWLQHRTLSL